jgi:two-component system sensor histidine kinase BaeS
MKWFRTLSGRITLVTVGVALLAVLVTGLVAFGLVRAAERDQARTLVGHEASALALLPADTALARLSERLTPALSGTSVAVVDSEGTTTGSAAQFLNRRILRSLVEGRSVSTTVRADGDSVIVEARPRKNGDSSIVVAQPLKGIDASVQAIVGRLIVALAIGLTVAIAAGALLARWIGGPLRRTASAARRLASGDRGVAMDRPGGATEVAEVADALHSLDAALVVSEGRQREFLLSISHELRTPLTALRGYAEALADGVVPPEDSAAVGATLVAETDRLDRFVRDLLELARLESDDFGVNRQTVDISILLDELQAAWRGLATTSGSRLDVRLDPETTMPILAHTDPQRLRQILDGLVENALRATPSGGLVTVSAGTTTGSASRELVLRVRDTGPGLTTDDREVAFVRGALHSRYHGSRDVGTGLGLSIATRLSSRLGGSLNALDPGPGEPGAVFELRLPLD